LVGIRQRQMQAPGTSVCASEVGPIFVGVPVALLCVVSVVSAWHGEAPWGGGLITAALTAAIIAVLSLFAGAVWLSICDWMTEVRSRVTWAAIGVVTDEFSSVALVDAPDPDDLYLSMAPRKGASAAAIRSSNAAIVASSCSMVFKC
jgi:hypothetical protein